MIFVFIFLNFFSYAEESKMAVREVSVTSCEAIRINLALRMTTQIIFEQKPKETLFADHKHFRINTSDRAPRSLAIIPFIEASELNAFRDAHGNLPDDKEMAKRLDESLKTNLFVYFDNSNQLLFHLHFVEQEKVDDIVKVKQIFNGSCNL